VRLRESKQVRLRIVRRQARSVNGMGRDSAGFARLYPMGALFAATGVEVACSSA